MLGYIIICAGLAMLVLSPIIHTIESLTIGVYDMSDAQNQALADLSAAVDAAVTQIAALVAANANIQPDDSAAIEAQVAKIKAALAPAAAPVAVAPVAPATPVA